ncbi:MAG: hypothetical protein ABI595_08855 [Actinomycetota bacterium]
MDDSSYSHCPNCLAEYRQGFDTCTDCGIALVRGPTPVPEEHAPDHTTGHKHATEDGYQVPVVLCQLPVVEAQILATKLEAEGLVVTVEEPALWTAYGTSISVTAGLRVWVLESQLEQAQKIARNALSGDDSI